VATTLSRWSHAHGRCQPWHLFTRGVWSGPAVLLIPGRVTRYHRSLTFHRPFVVLALTCHVPSLYSMYGDPCLASSLGGGTARTATAMNVTIQ
jgi:hypothetical protein